MTAPGTDDACAARRVVLGRITGVFGTRGWVKLHSYTRPPTGIFGYGVWQVGADAAWREFTVADHGGGGRGLRAHLRGVDDPDAARRLVGNDVAVDRAQMPDPAPGQYYWCDLIGLEVFDQTGQSLGKVAGLRETGANDILVVDGVTRTLIPFVAGRYIKGIDFARRRIEVDWIPGYL